MYVSTVNLYNMSLKDKIHTTNYTDTFIEVSEDCPAQQSEIPKAKGDSKTIAQMQYELIAKHPYGFTSDDILFQVYADKNDLTKSEYNKARADFFSKGQPCLRASPLTKRYGFGVHANSEGKVALYGVETKDYQQMLHDETIKKVKAMRNTKK